MPEVLRYMPTQLNEALQLIDRRDQCYMAAIGGGVLNAKVSLELDSILVGYP
jgi:hypothetical protein